MIHSFVAAKLLPRLPAWATYGQRVAPSLVTTPFLALHLHESPAEAFVFQRKPNLFVITCEKPSSPESAYFVLNARSQANVRSLTVVPPLPFKAPLYLSVTPRISANFPDTESYERLAKAEKYQLDDASLERFLKALEEAAPSIPSTRVTGGDDEPGQDWDTWSGESPQEAPGALVLRRQVPFYFDLIPFDSLAHNCQTNVFEELPLMRQLTRDYTWERCRLITEYIESMREAMPRLAASGRIFRPPAFLSSQDRSPDPSVDALRPCTSHLLSLPVVHDGDHEPEQEDELADDWKDEEMPVLEMLVAAPVPAVQAEDLKIVAFDFNTLIDRDGPLQDALADIFPPSKHLFATKELLDLYVEHETLRAADRQPDSTINVIQQLGHYLGVSVEDSTIRNAINRFATPRAHSDAQDTIKALVKCGFTPVALPTATWKDSLSKIQGLSLALFDSAAQTPPFSWDSLLSFARQTNPNIRSSQILVVTSDLYRIGESASQAGFPTAFVKAAGSRSAKLSIPTIAPTYTFTSLTELLPALLDPASVPAPGKPVNDQMNPPFRIHDTYQCTFLLGSGSFAYVWNGIQLHTGAAAAIKFEMIHPTNPATLPYEAAIYAQLHGVLGIPRIHWSGQEKNANMLVMDKLGPNLEQLRRFCRGSFGLKTVLMLGEQMLSTIEQVHGRGIIVRDIKPQNFALGLVEEHKRLHLLDMGLCKLYMNPITGNHMLFREGRGGIGTPRYASHNVHFGLEPSRRDDVEAIGILMLYLFYGRLPWQGICSPDIPSKLRRIGEMKRGKPFSDLIAHSPMFFDAFFKHCRSLRFEDKPDYAYLRMLLRTTMEEHGWEYDWEYDWWKAGERGTLILDEYKMDLRFVEPVRHEQDVL